MGAANKRKMSRVLLILLLTKEGERARSAHWKDDLAAGERVKGRIFGVGWVPEGSSALMLK